MNLYSNKIITNIVNKPVTRKIVSSLANPSALLPVILLEGCVIAGRTYQANKRGGFIEARERLTEEVTTSAVWLFGVAALNKVFEKILKKSGIPCMDYDIGKDALFDPFRRALSKIKNISKLTETQLSAIKFGKIILASATAIFMCGNVIPKLNQKITKAMTIEKADKDNTKNVFSVTNKPQNLKNNMQDFLNSVKTKPVSFKNGAAFTEFLRLAAHNLEKNNIVKLLSIDSGVLSGRAVNARNSDERNEIIFREVASSYFYLFASQHVYKLLSNSFDKYKGITNIDPLVAHYLDGKIRDKISKKTISPQEFKKLILGTDNIEHEKFVANLFNDIHEKIIKLKDFKELLQRHSVDKTRIQEIMDKAEQILKLRVQKVVSTEKLLTRSEVYNCMHGGLINDPQILKELVNQATEGNSLNFKKFVSINEIDDIKKQVSEYAEDILKYTKNKTINSKILTEVKNRNTIMKFGLIASGMAVSALFLSTIIPKIQYLITANKTGKNEFPGARGLKLKQNSNS